MSDDQSNILAFFRKVTDQIKCGAAGSWFITSDGDHCVQCQSKLHLPANQDLHNAG